MKTLLGRCGAVLAGAGALLAVPSPASAHEKWFVENPGTYPTDWAFALRPVAFTLIVAAVLATLVWRYVAVRFLPTPELRVLRFVGRLVPYVPRLLAVHLGVSLLAAALLLLEGALGIWFITGVRLRPAAIGLALAGPLALMVTGPDGLLSAVDLLGVA